MQSYLLNHQYDFFPRTNDFRSTEEDLDFNVKEPFLYVSLGTIHKQNRALLQNMIWILSELQIPSVISAGEYYKSFHNPSPNIIQLHSFVPQIHILKHSYCRGFISHGGMNSVVEAWSNKIPLYIIPQTLEQLLTGIQIQEIHGGFVIRKKHPSFRSLYNFPSSPPSSLRECLVFMYLFWLPFTFHSSKEKIYFYFNALKRNEYVTKKTINSYH